MNIGEMMKTAQAIKQQLEENQAQAAQRRVRGEAGGGMVEVVMNGLFEIVELNIEPQAIDRNEQALLQDLIVAACNQAVSKTREAASGSIGEMASQLGIDPSSFGFPAG